MPHSNILSIINKLKSDNSRLFKEQVLKENIDNKLLQSVLVRTLGSHIQYYQRKIPVYTPNSTGTLELIKALEQLNDLADRKYTGNAAIDYLTKILSSVHSDDAKVIELIIKKDLDCGVQIATVNKIWKGLVSEFNTMLCTPINDKLVEKLKWPQIAQCKMDGLRVNIVVVGDTVTFYSRNGKTFDLLGNLEQEFIKIANGQDLVFDGELLVDNNGKDADRQTGNGILNKCQKGTATKEEADNVVTTLWDIIPYHKWLSEKDTTPYTERFALLNSFNFPDKIRIVESKLVYSIDEAQTISDDYIKQGLEGIILKDPSTIWEAKRSKGQLKIKAEEIASLVVVGIQEGNGKYTGQVGSLICETSDGKLKVSVGSGLNDEDRLSITNADIGRIIEVKYNTLIKSKGKETSSLFLPRFLGFREDIDVADILEHLK